MDPFHRHFAYHSIYKLNTDAMKEAAKYLVGKHDFSAFVNAQRNDRILDPLKNIFRFDIIEMVNMYIIFPFKSILPGPDLTSFLSRGWVFQPT